MILITESLIQEEYEVVLRFCSTVYALKNWVHAPTGLVLHSSKTSWGLATTCGMVKINSLFVGSTAIIELRSTIRHELAHLAAGLKVNHNQYFKRVANAF
ncbi:MAG: hypothetical protein HAW66_04785 [Shewanella sp.]|nr:hypothetical protein [Shewanella sp.]